ncbi:MAG: MaoC/PaaZ C-terminal domain-containing protein [Pseudomonadales bacterium]|jgi:acyl dehydratase
MTRVNDIIAEVHHLFGHEVGISEWIVIDQQKIDDHARTTGDDSWMHTDPERTGRESPFGCTIAQSFLVLSCLTDMVAAVKIPIPGIVYRQNYGFDRVRIVQPVRVDNRIRGRFELNRIEPKGPHGMLVHLDVSIDIEDDDIAPAVVAEWLAYVRIGE